METTGAGGAGSGAGGAGGTAASSGGAQPTACDRCPELSVSATAAGASIRVDDGGDLQAAIDQAMPGDEILLQPGARYLGGIVLPDKSGRAPIVVRTADPSMLEPCTRIDSGALATLPKIVGTAGEPAIVSDRGHDWHFVGVELGVEGDSISQTVVKLGSESQSDPAQLPQRIVFDRVYVRGDPRHGTLWGIWINAEDVTIANSRIADLWEPVQSNLEAHAVVVDNTPGGVKLVNNHLESAWAQLVVGAHASGLDNVVPAGIEARLNHFTRPERWIPLNANGWHLRSFVALYSAKLVTIDANVLDTSLFRAAFVLEPDRRGGSRPWAEVSDVRITNNRVDRVDHGLWIHPTDQDVGGMPHTKGVLLDNNLITSVAGDLVTLWGQAGEGIEAIELRHNTALQSGRIFSIDNSGNTGTFFDNVLVHGSYGIFCNGGPGGQGCLDAAFDSWEFDYNLVITSDSAAYPQSNNEFVMADPGFVDQARGDYRLRSTSPGSGAASDGKDMGVDLAALEAAAICRSAPDGG